MTACCTSRTACKPVTDFSPFQWTDQIFSYFGFESYETNQIGSINSTGWNFDEENVIRGGFSLTEFSSRWINGRKPLTWASPLSDGLVRRTFYNSLGQEKATLDKLGHVERLSTLSQTGRSLFFFFCSRILADLTKLVSFNEKIRNRTNSRCAIDGIYRQTNGKLDRSIDAFESVSSPSPSAFVRPSKIGCASLFLFVPSINRLRPRCLGCGRADNSS